VGRSVIGAQHAGKGARGVGGWGAAARLESISGGAASRGAHGHLLTLLLRPGPHPRAQEWSDGPPAKVAGAAVGLLAALLTLLARGRAPRPPPLPPVGP
jgi:hypothetical protein